MDNNLADRKKIIKEYIIIGYLVTALSFGLFILYALSIQEHEWWRNPNIFNLFVTLLCLGSLYIIQWLNKKDIQISRPKFSSYIFYFLVPFSFVLIMVLTGISEFLFFRLFLFLPLFMSIVSFGQNFGFYSAGSLAVNLSLLNYLSGQPLFCLSNILFLFFSFLIVWLMGGLVELERENQKEIHKRSVNRLQNSEIEAFIERNNELRAQKHDFYNHLQVMFTMLQLEKYKDCERYIQKLVEADSSPNEEDVIGNATIDSLILAKKKHADDNNITFKTEINTDFNNVMISPEKLAKILFNLIDNAVNVLKEERGIEKEIRVQIEERKDHIDIEVTNTGPAIPLKIQDKIFNMGFSTQDGEEHGYGLYIVKKIIEDLGGTITFSSDSKVTTFECSLPLKNKNNSSPST